MLKKGQDFLPPYDLNKKYYVDEMLRLTQENKDVESTKLLKRIIFEHIVESSFASGNSSYEKFINTKLKNVLSNEVTIISFNFDFLLCEDFKESVYFDYLIDFDWIDDNREKIYNKSNSIPLIKLNGSLDWGFCPACKNIKLFFPHMRSFDYGNLRCINNKCTGYIEPLIVAPYEKGNRRINRLWARAGEDIKKAKRITVIGYSFPPYDKKAIELFANSMDPDVELKVVDYEERQDRIAGRTEEIRGNYKRMFPRIKQNIKIELGGFENYITNQG